MPPSGSIVFLANPAPLLVPAATTQDSGSAVTAKATSTSTSSSAAQGLGIIAVVDSEVDVFMPQQRSNSQGDALHFELSLTGSIRNQLVLENQSYSFKIPDSVFHHSNPNEHLEFKAASASGGALPTWLKFDPKTLTFSGIPPKGANSETIIVTAKDSNGQEVHASFNVDVNKGDAIQADEIRSDQDGKPQNAHPEKTGQPKTNVQGRMKNNIDAILGKPGFTEQVHAVGKLSRLQESRALLDSLKQL